MLNSAIFRGRVDHTRQLPFLHRFRYKLFLVYLDLDEVSSVEKLHPLWSIEKRNVASFYAKDHAAENVTELKRNVLREIESQGFEAPCGPVRVLCHFRYFGFIFNPVSLFYCFDESETLKFVVAEVRNTPWFERHWYVLPITNNRVEVEMPSKVFHVSPFLPLDMKYNWSVTVPSEQVEVGLENWRGSEKHLSVKLELEREPMTSTNLSRVLVRFPFMTMRVVAGIYWQALCLWWKGAKFYPHPNKQKKKSALDQKATYEAGT